MSSLPSTKATAMGRPAAARGKPAPKSLFASFTNPPPKLFTRKELIGLFRGLSSMLRAQINTADALKYYAHGLPDKGMVDALNKICVDITAGVSIHEAFRRTGRFSDTIIGLVQAGSDAGQLHEAFRALAVRLTSEAHFKKQVRKATLVPGIIISVLIGAFMISQIKIVPQVEEMLSGVGQKADGLTAISFTVSHFIQKTWFLIIGGLIGFGVTVGVSAKVRNFILGLGMSRWRLMRNLVLGLRQMTFLSTMRLLHSNGINLAKSIRVSANSVKNTPFYNELRNAADKYEHSGVPLSTAFAKYTSVDPQVTHMLAIGEKSASIDNQLEMLCEMYEEDAQNNMVAFAATVNFLVLLIAVGLIAAVFVGTFLPIFLMGPKMMNSAL
ncbi:MAG: type II secretion system F family protein [Akkermansiaceae bacterium]|nr:type II secretion system F family protein [Akkermansiaceae bacterium]